MNKQTYFNNQYALYQYHNKAPELHYQDFTLQLTPEGTIHLTTPSKEFDSVAGLFETIKYWQNSHYEYSNTLIGLEIANAISEVMLYSGLRFPYYMISPYYDFINASLRYFTPTLLCNYPITSLEYYRIYHYFHKDYYSNKYLKPYLTENIGRPAYTNLLAQAGFKTELEGLPFFCKRDKDYFISLKLSEEGFIEIPIPKRIIEKTNDIMKLRSYYRTLCNLLYHSGHTLTEEGKLHSNKYYTIAEEYKPSLEILLQKVKSHLKEC